MENAIIIIGVDLSGFVGIRPCPDTAGTITKDRQERGTTTDVGTKVVFIQKSGNLWTIWATRRLLYNSGV